MKLETKDLPHAKIIQAKLAELLKVQAAQSSRRDLLKILERKGLTTPVQWYFIQKAIENLERRITEQIEAYDVLLEGCQLILEEAGYEREFFN